MRGLGFYELPQSAAEVSFLVPFYRTSEIYDLCCDLNLKISMLHPDILALLYHFGRHLEAPILELGPYVGGSTVALAKGALAGGRKTLIVSVEKGGTYTHDTLSSDDIVMDLKTNLRDYEVADLVEVVEGHSRQLSTFEAVKNRVGAEKFGLLMIDADGHVEQDLSIYRPVLHPNAYLIVDDFYAPGARDKEATTSTELNSLERQGVVRSFGVYGWGTWLGHFC